VWSQDSDCLMFGCQLWIRDHRTPKDEEYDNRNKGHTKKAAKIVRVVRVETLSEKHRLRREGCVLFAILAGGDYNVSGLPRCGAATALKAAQSGLGISLCNAKSQDDCNRWREKVLLPYFRRQGIQMAVPVGFPDLKYLQWYNKPKVLADTVLNNNAQLQSKYTRKVREKDLLLVTSHRFNIWGNGYMDWVVPTMLTQYLATMDTEPPNDALLQIKLVGRQGKKPDAQPRVLERKITFSPFGLTKLLRPLFLGEMRGYWCKSGGEFFDPDHRVECEIPTYLLQKILPPQLHDPPTPRTKPSASKRKDRHNASGQDEQPVATGKRLCKSRTPLSAGNVSPSRHSIAEPSVIQDDSELRLPPSRKGITSTARTTTTTLPLNTPGKQHRAPIVTERSCSHQAANPMNPPRAALDELDVQEAQDLQRAIDMSLGAHQTKVGSLSKTAKTSTRPLQVLDIIDLTDL